MIKINEVELESSKQLHQKFLTAVLWGLPPTLVKYEDSLKWAWVVINDSPTMLYVSNKDMRAYKTEGYHYLLPLQEVSYQSFTRWCTTFDL